MQTLPIMKSIRYTFALIAVIVANSTALRAQDPLPSWNDGPAKQAILDFVRDTTETGGAKFVPAEERIATFDQDGTLWVEHPMYSQVLYCLERVPEVAKKKPSFNKIEPFTTVLSGNRKAIAKLSLKDLEKILVATLTGMSVEEFKAEVTNGSQLPSTRGSTAIYRADLSADAGGPGISARQRL